MKINQSIIKVIQIAILRGVGAISLLLVTYVVTQTLDLVEAGKFLYLLSLITVIAPVMVFGTNFPSLRMIAVLDGHDQHARLNGIVVSGLGIVLAGWCLLFLIVGLVMISPFRIPSQEHWLYAAAPIVILVGLQMSFSILIAHQLQGLRLPTHSIIVLSIASPVVFAIGMALMPSLFLDARDAVILLFFSTLSALIYGAVILIRNLQWHKPGHIELSSFLEACLPIWVVAISTVLTNWGAQVISVFYLKPDTIALLNVSQRLAMSVSLLLIAVNLVISPRIARLYSEGNMIRLQALVSKAVLGVSLCSLPVILFICLFPDFLLSLFGPSYVAASLFLVIFGISQLVNVVTGPSVQLLTMCGFEKVVMKIAVVSCVITLLLAFLLIDLLGPVGVPIATGTGIAMQNISSAFAARRLVGINILHIPKNLLKRTGG